MIDKIEINTPAVVSMMGLLDKFRDGDSLENILCEYKFNFVFGVLHSIVGNNEKSYIGKYVKSNASQLYQEILETYPIEKFPEKYI